MDLGVSSVVGWSATDFWVPEIVSCGSAGLGAGSWFSFLGVLDFVNGGADTVLWYCSVLFLCISAACFFGGIVIGMPNAPIFVLAWETGGISGVDFWVVVPLTSPLDVASAERF